MTACSASSSAALASFPCMSKQPSLRWFVHLLISLVFVMTGA
jgi:hypothetical protein